MTSLRSRQHGSKSNKSSAIQACFMVVRGADNDDNNDNIDDANDNNDDANDNIDDDDGTQLGTQSSRKLLGNNHLLRNSAGLTEKGSRNVQLVGEAQTQASLAIKWHCWSRKQHVTSCFSLGLYY